MLLSLALSIYTSNDEASMAIYQFLVAVRAAEKGPAGASAQLTDENGNVTSHLMGCLSRTVKLLEAGIKPVWVFGVCSTVLFISRIFTH